MALILFQEPTKIWYRGITAFRTLAPKIAGFHVEIWLSKADLVPEKLIMANYRKLRTNSTRMQDVPHLVFSTSRDFSYSNFQIKKAIFEFIQNQIKLVWVVFSVQHLKSHEFPDSREDRTGDWSLDRCPWFPEPPFRNAGKKNILTISGHDPHTFSAFYSLLSLKVRNNLKSMFLVWVRYLKKCLKM